MEKFIPKVVKQILNDETVVIHSYPDKTQSGTRFYIHARNISAAVLFLIKNGNIGESYNLTGEKEIKSHQIRSSTLNSYRNRGKTRIRDANQVLVKLVQHGHMRHQATQIFHREGRIVGVFVGSLVAQFA